MPKPIIQTIESFANPRLKDLLKLRQIQTKAQVNNFIAEGEHFCQIANAKNHLQELWISQTAYDKLVWEIQPKVRVYLLSATLLNKISLLKNGATMLGVCVKPISENFFHDALLILDRLQDPGNLGTLIRSAAAFGFKTVVASLDSVNFYNPKVLQATQGLIFEINLVNHDLVTLLPDLKQRGYYLITTFLNHEPSLKPPMAPLQAPFGLLIGNEGQGLSSQWATFSDYNFVIPTQASVESLNAAVAGSIIMYELNQLSKEN